MYLVMPVLLRLNTVRGDPEEAYFLLTVGSDIVLRIDTKAATYGILQLSHGLDAGAADDNRAARIAGAGAAAAGVQSPGAVAE